MTALVDALILVLCAGLLTNQFFSLRVFFLAKSNARYDLFDSCNSQTEIVVFHDSTQRIYDSISDVHEVYSDEARSVLAKEMTTPFETFLPGITIELLAMFDSDSTQLCGKIFAMLSST